MDYRFNFRYKVNNQVKETKSIDNEDFSVLVAEKNGILNVSVSPKTPVSFEKFEIVKDCDFPNTSRIFANGFQSWTVSREYAPKDSMDEFNPRFMGMQKKYFNFIGMWCAGDLTFHKYPEKSGIFYGYSYGYIRQGNDITLFGSLSERSGYTIITFDTNNGTIAIEKDLAGVTYDEEAQVLSLATINDNYENAFDKYFELMDIKKPTVTRKCGYTTWYNYYTGVTEEIVRRDLASITKLDAKVDIFQIDDGYQRTVGDWLITDDKKFPTGMKAVADEIHKHDILAGLWLAPFAVTPKSYIFREHKDWLVRNEKGRYNYAGQNWGGFYALDIYNEEVRDYIRKVFDTVLNVWGYDMVKLDFLYACSIVPMHGKSRGEIMCDAVDFIRECCGDKIILGCGVPLAPAFGKFDFCRIGADVGLTWKNKAFSREDVSTQNTLLNTIFRRHLDGRAWLNDPDVFLLRDYNIDMPMPQREIIADVNSLCGNLLFVSDDVATYSAKQAQIFTNTVTRSKAAILSANINVDNDVSIDYELNGQRDNLTFNIKTGIKRVK